MPCRIPNSARGYLGYVLSHLGDSQILPLMEAAVEARTELAPMLPGNRELLYLDLALEDQVRQAAERGVGSAGEHWAARWLLHCCWGAQLCTSCTGAAAAPERRTQEGGVPGL